MKRLQSSLITRIALLVIGVEMVAFGALGWFYIDRFSSAADERARSRLELVGRLIAQEELQIDAVARTTLMSDLLGMAYREGIVVGGNGRVIVATDASYLGRSIREIPAFNRQWIASEAPDRQYIPGPDALTCVMRISGAQGRSVYHLALTIDTTALTAQKRTILLVGCSASLLFILLSSIGIVLFAQRFIGRRVDNTLQVLKRVESGAMDARIPVKSLDEMGQLQVGINSMIETLATLLARHGRNVEELSKEIAERREAEEALKGSQERFLTILDSLDAIVYVADMKTYELIFVNKHAQDLFGDIEGKNCWETLQAGQTGPCDFCTNDKLVDAQGQPSAPYQWELKNTRTGHLFYIVDRAINWVDGRIVRLEIATDITERKRAESVALARLRTLDVTYTPGMTLDDTLQVVLDEIEAHTGSTIGFYHFLGEDQETLTLQNWSTNTIKNMCTAEGKGSHYSISKAGVWVDCVREKRPVIHNDYASLPHRQGMPPGHAPVVRELVVPIIRGERIVAVIGVGNKPTDYNETDVQIALLLGDFSWEIVKRKRAEEELLQLNQELEQRVKERTAELEKKTLELERANRLFVGRELRMVELKRRLRGLEEKISK